MLSLLIPWFQFLYQEAEAIPSDTGRACQHIVSSEKILDKNIIINLAFSGVHFGQIVTGHHENPQFFSGTSLPFINVNESTYIYHLKSGVKMTSWKCCDVSKLYESWAC